MKADLDRLMAESDLEAIWVTGSAGGNPSLDYFVGRAHLNNVHLLKKRGEPPLLLHGAMEREEAQATGLRSSALGRDRFLELLDQTEGDKQRARALQLADHMHALGLSGRVAVYGQVEAGPFMELHAHLSELLPEVTWVPGSGAKSVLALARITKDRTELERIRRMGQITVEVADRIRSFLSEREAVDGGLLDEDGEPLTVGAVKDRVHRLLAERRAESPSGPIFAQGREGAIGHSVGRDEAQVRTGTTIVFDLYPRELGGGYHFDFTRTWCLGEAPAEAQRIFEDVKAVYEAVLPQLKAGASTRELQLETCAQFEALGHPTVMSDPDTRSGYIHSLAHGIGLAIHEAPTFSQASAAEDTRLEPGMVFTFEPGLYYPAQEIGVRLEDTVYVREDGAVERLASHPHTLLIPLATGRAA